MKKQLETNEMVSKMKQYLSDLDCRLVRNDKAFVIVDHISRFSGPTKAEQRKKKIASILDE